MPTKMPISIRPSGPSSRNTVAHGTMKMISRSKMMNWIAIR